MSGTGPGSEASNRGRFRKGQSGNPGGRPRKRETASASAFDIVVGKTLSVTRKGVPREITMEEALQHRTYQDAIAGKRMAQREVLRWIQKREAWLNKHTRTPEIQAVKVLRAQDPANADEAMLLLGIVREDPHSVGPWFKEPQQLLEPWAVQMALDRRRGQAPLDQQDVETIRRCTRQPERLRWQRKGPP